MKVQINEAYFSFLEPLCLWYQGANFRDLPGVRVRADNKVEWDPDVERKKVTSGKPLVRFALQVSSLVFFGG